MPYSQKPCLKTRNETILTSVKQCKSLNSKFKQEKQDKHYYDWPHEIWGGVITCIFIASVGYGKTHLDMFD